MALYTKQEDLPKTTTHINLFPTPFHDVILTLSLLLWIQRLVVSCWCRCGVMTSQNLEFFCSGSMTFLPMISSLIFFPSPLWGIYICLLMCKHITLFSVVHSSRLHSNSLSMVPFMYVRYYFFVLFLTPRTSYVKLQLSNVFTECCEFSGPVWKPVSHLYSPCAITCYHALSLLFPRLTMSYISILDRCVRIVNISFYLQ